MFIFMTLLLLLIGGIIVSLLGFNLYIGFAIMLILSLVLCSITYFFSKGMALKANGARLVTEQDEPRLYRIVRSVADKAGIPMPDVGVSEVYMLNAFAAGRNPKNAVIVATRGLMETLNDEELEGVIAHEAAHIKNRDILVMTVAAGMSAVITFAARSLIYMSFASRERRAEFIILALVAYITFPIAAALVQLAISRKREYLADATGAKITGNPLALASALERISAPSMTVTDYKLQPRPDDRVSPTTAHMWISSPFRGKSAMRSLFSTHPPIEDRIARLRKMAGVL